MAISAGGIGRHVASSPANEVTAKNEMINDICNNREKENFM
jgi:hypothetical protein